MGFFACTFIINIFWSLSSMDLHLDAEKVLDTCCYFLFID